VLLTLPDVAGPGNETRNIYVALPPGYRTSDRRYPVVYLQDGQNLFDPKLSFAGDWKLRQTLKSLGRRKPAILVGIPNLGPDRLREYSPFDDPVRGVGEGVGYLSWLTETVKPLVDDHFRTLPERQHTAVAGSSMGGLLAMYALVGGAATFGAAWVMSPAFWFADGRVFDWLRRQPSPVGRLWLDVGHQEGASELADVRRMHEFLVDRGWVDGVSLHYHEDPKGGHDEVSWGRRVRENWGVLVGMVEP
jgi:predicted alpha/beta superfamily hydrolase